MRTLVTKGCGIYLLLRGIPVDGLQLPDQRRTGRLGQFDLFPVGQDLAVGIERRRAGDNGIQQAAVLVALLAAEGIRDLTLWAAVCL